jgi:hypothetical protein
MNWWTIAGAAILTVVAIGLTGVAISYPGVTQLNAMAAQYRSQELPQRSRGKVFEQLTLQIAVELRQGAVITGEEVRSYCGPPDFVQEMPDRWRYAYIYYRSPIPEAVLIFVKKDGLVAGVGWGTPPVGPGWIPYEATGTTVPSTSTAAEE